jgi:transcription antitermination protein NusB
MSARSKARKRALDVLYEADIRGIEATEVFAATVERRTDEGQASLNAYVAEIVAGVTEHREYIDELLGSYSMGWSLDRMPAVDRAILRIGTYELLWRDDVPDGVAIAEAVALAQELSTEESSSFVNGLLGRILELKPRLAVTADPPAESPGELPVEPAGEPAAPA